MAKKESSEPIIQEALERFQESQEGDDFNRSAYEEDVKFSRLGDQWTINGKDYKAERLKEGRPALTINKLPSFIRQVVNESRQSKPAIKVSPVDNGADVATADVITGLIRSIERGSSADVAYDTAIEHAVTGGVGYFRIGIEYSHPDSFDMECVIKRIPNPLMVHRDVDSMEFDASDWNYGFISQFYTEDEFEKAFPDADPVSFNAGSGNDLMSSWIEDEKIRVAEYWLREQKQRDLILFKGASEIRPIREDQLPLLAKAAAEAGGIDVSGIKDDELVQFWIQTMGLEEVRRRTVDYYEVTRRLINGQEVLKEEPWPGSMIPICPVYGDEVVIDGRRHLRSLTRDARDAQSMFNFWRSASTELVALAPRAPWIGPEGFVPEGKEDLWQTANTRSHAYLEYNPAAGGAPQRQPFAGVPGGALQEALNASDDMKAIIGIYDSSLGARSNETSGRAIMARQREADVSNFHFLDNLSRAIRYAGQILVEVIPSVYSARQTIRILGEDQTEKVIKLTQEDGGGVINPETGDRELYNLSVGHYDVTVSTGPSYATQREETREVLMELMRQVPGSAEFIGDIFLKYMDFQGADEVAKRLNMLLQAKGMVPGAGMPGGVPGQSPAMMGQQPGLPPQPPMQGGNGVGG